VLLPDKHLKLSESVIGLAGLVLSDISKPTWFDALWMRVQEKTGTPDWPAVHGVENFVLSLCFLYSVGAIDVTQNGELVRCD
jgi:hypothetical protein